MPYQGPLNQISENIYEIPIKHKQGMRVPGRVYASPELLEKMKGDLTLTQCVNVAHLPGIQKFAITLPDGHQGYGFPIGGVGATDVNEGGVISPGGVGYDINCGVRLLWTTLERKEVEPKLDNLLSTLFRTVPSGVGAKGQRRFSKGELDEALLGGVKWAVEQGYGWRIDASHCESQGSLEHANPDKISEKAKSRGQPQLGTLGSGNHFLELQYVEKIYDERIAKAFGITNEGQVTVMIHTGSRGFGHQVCSDYLRVMERAVRKYNIQLPDRELACAPGTSREGEDYFAAMACAANFAWANRQFITHWVREGFDKWYKTDPEELGLQLIYDVAHNICKQERHVIDGKTKSLFVHRKGATRAFPAGHPDLPQDYKPIGQPVILPGSMGTASYLLCGQDAAMEYSFGSTAHGAGRVMSRHKAKKRYFGEKVASDLRQRGIFVYATSKKVIAEEAPGAYKDINQVAKVSNDVGIASFVCKLRPMGVVKG
jgi:tRNA-splicing ligase RtcB